jgi:hypothetical protein
MSIWSTLSNQNNIPNSFIVSSFDGTFICNYAVDVETVPKISFDSGNTWNNADIPKTNTYRGACISGNGKICAIIGFDNIVTNYRIYYFINNKWTTLSIDETDITVISINCINCDYSGNYLFIIVNILKTNGNNECCIYRYVNDMFKKCNIINSYNVFINYITCMDIGKVYACGNNATFYKSIDKGLNFTCYQLETSIEIIPEFNYLDYDSLANIYIVHNNYNSNYKNISKYENDALLLTPVSTIYTNTTFTKIIAVNSDILYYINNNTDDGTTTVNYNNGILNTIIINNIINNINSINKSSKLYITLTSGIIYKSFDILLNNINNNYINSDITISFNTTYSEVLYFTLYSPDYTYYNIIYEIQPNIFNFVITSIEEKYFLNTEYYIYVSNSPITLTFTNSVATIGSIGSIHFLYKSISVDTLSFNNNILDTITVPLNPNSNFIYLNSEHNNYIKYNLFYLNSIEQSFDSGYTYFNPIYLYKPITGYTNITNYKNVTGFYIQIEDNNFENYGEIKLLIDHVWIAIEITQYNPNILDKITITTTLKNTVDTNYIDELNELIVISFNSDTLFSYTPKSIFTGSFDLYNKQFSGNIQSYSINSTKFSSLSTIESSPITINPVWIAIEITQYTPNILDKITITTTLKNTVNTNYIDELDELIVISFNSDTLISYTPKSIFTGSFDLYNKQFSGNIQSYSINSTKFSSLSTIKSSSITINPVWIAIEITQYTPNILDKITITTTLKNTVNTNYIDELDELIVISFNSDTLISYTPKSIFTGSFDLYNKQFSGNIQYYFINSTKFSSLSTIKSSSITIDLIWATITFLNNSELYYYYNTNLITIQLKNTSSTTIITKSEIIDIKLNGDIIKSFIFTDFELIDGKYTYKYSWNPWENATIGNNTISIQCKTYPLEIISKPIIFFYTIPTISIETNNYSIIQTIPITFNIYNNVGNFFLNVVDVDGNYINKIYQISNETTYNWMPYMDIFSYNTNYRIQLISEDKKVSVLSDLFSIYQKCLIIDINPNDKYSNSSSIRINWDKLSVDTTYSIYKDIFDIILIDLFVAINVLPIYRWIPYNTSSNLSGIYLLTIKSDKFYIYGDVNINIINSSKADYGTLENKKLGVSPCSSITLTPALARATTNTICLTTKKNNVATTTIKINKRTFIVPCGVAKYIPELELLLTRMNIREAILFLIKKYNIEIPHKNFENKKRYIYPTADAKIKYPILQFNTSFRLGNLTDSIIISNNPLFSEKNQDSMILEICNDDTKTFSSKYTDMLVNATYWLGTLPSFVEYSYVFCIIRPTNGSLKNAISGSIVLINNTLVFTPIILKILLFYYKPYKQNTDITIIYSNTEVNAIFTYIQEQILSNSNNFKSIL